MQIAHLNPNQRAVVVAEIGNNHEGSYSAAEAMVGEAIRAGADAVKLQTFVPEFYVSRVLDPQRFARLNKFCLTHDEFKKLAAYAESAGSVFFSTPFDLASAEFLAAFCPALKIASGDNTFFPLLDRVASFGKPMILSTGLLDLSGVETAVEFLEAAATRQKRRMDLAILHCVANYPVPKEQANLGAILALRQRFPNFTIGYSDHTLGIEACVLAVAAGARIIEKHFTLDHHYSDFRDHQLSATPAELRELVERVRTVEAMLGPIDKLRQLGENEDTVRAMRRSIAAKRELPSGAMITAADITWVRPGTAIPPGQESLVVGKQTARSLAPGELISLGDLKN
jgi:N,N'-diacetyllegionaminate synthase